MYTIVTYLGMLIAAGILFWGVWLVTRRYLGRKKVLRGRVMNDWVPFDPATMEDDEVAGTPSDLSTRARQNGHFSTEKHPRY
ncbi:hypothetical protein EI42_00480 [Thermosporothrix hazakensis]|jgi:hypothetical protein|uniref:Uncharacterized protein n=2 Tax=Thermosporothrix TaxID=768650 RepID=A0A326UDE7_THEHA|nr:hypothetical protein [Thermosporothrix hazakensis]PZW36306.1 hypothetical protein EI42_00480 [Thermosporothrix hazakensis]BBH88772.1 hypothetical protein KTC_35230 [Thermosporothrix sp. COM3]GCE46956.1 hypothetical protein KTH_18250 [Thermosporothrix hazakensis]